MSDSVYSTAQKLAERIFREVWPHAEGLPAAHERNRDIPAEARIPHLAADTVPAKGDVVLVNRSGRFGFGARHLDNLTTREAVTAHGTRLCVVTAATPKTLTVVELIGHVMWRTDLDALDTETFGLPRRISRTAGSIELGYLGPLPELQARFRGHPLFDEWQTARNAALAEQEQETREMETEHERAVAAAVPFQEAAGRLNRAIGAQVVDVTVSGISRKTRFTRGWEWLAWECDDYAVPHGRIYLYGLVFIGELAKDKVQGQLIKDMDMLAEDSREGAPPTLSPVSAK